MRFSSGKFIVLPLLALLTLATCKKVDIGETGSIVGEWSINAMVLAIYQDQDVDVDILEVLCDEEGSIRFDKDHKGVFKSDCNPKRIPAQFNWETAGDTLQMDFYGFVIQPLYQLIEEDAMDYLNLLFALDSVGPVSYQDTVLQIRMEREK